LKRYGARFTRIGPQAPSKTSRELTPDNHRDCPCVTPTTAAATHRDTRSHDSVSVIHWHTLQPYAVARPRRNETGPNHFLRYGRPDSLFQRCFPGHQGQSSSHTLSRVHAEMKPVPSTSCEVWTPRFSVPTMFPRASGTIKQPYAVARPRRNASRIHSIMPSLSALERLGRRHGRRKCHHLFSCPPISAICK
jgi:hypothetical protein